MYLQEKNTRTLYWIACAFAKRKKAWYYTLVHYEQSCSPDSFRKEQQPKRPAPRLQEIYQQANYRCHSKQCSGKQEGMDVANLQKRRRKEQPQ